MGKYKNDTCGELVYQVKNEEGLLNRHLIRESKSFNHFIKAWIKKIDNTKDEFIEKMIYLWVTVNAWASIVVPDRTRNYSDSYLIHSMSADEQFNDRFNNLMSNNDIFRDNVRELLSKAPIFQVLWLRNKNAIPWDPNTEDRKDFTERIMILDPYNRNAKDEKFPAFSPICAEKHKKNNEKIPIDWAHTLHTIYQIRCNLFHGGKDYSNDRDQRFIELSYKILREMFEDELFIEPELNWDRIFIRSGFLIDDLSNKGDEIKYDLKYENEANRAYFSNIISELDLSKYLIGNIFSPPKKSIKQRYWFEAVGKVNPHSGIDLPDLNKIDLSLLDPYIAGVVRWINKAGLVTTFSCEGHGNDMPKIIFNSNDRIIFEVCLKILQGHGLTYFKNNLLIENGKINSNYKRNILNDSKLKLLDFAEILYKKNQELSELIVNMKKFQGGKSFIRSKHMGVKE